MQPRQQFDEAEWQWHAPRARQAASGERMILRARHVEEPRATRKPAQPNDHKSESAEQEQWAKRSAQCCSERDTQKKAAFEA